MHRNGWKNNKHAHQWVRTFKTYAHPKIGAKPVDAIGTEDVLSVLKPIWNTKTETAKRVQGRIKNILDYAAAYGHPGSDQPGPLAGTPGQAATQAHQDEAQIWTIPASRMKAGHEHRVPLSEAALAMLEALPKVHGNPYLVSPVLGMAAPLVGHGVASTNARHGLRAPRISLQLPRLVR